MKNVLSLFNGISGCHLALDRAGIEYEKVYYAEIDKYANQVTQHHYPQDIALGDVTKWQDWDIDWSSIDLVTAVFPCQAWSVAGKQLGDKDERGMLFWTTLEIISQVLKHNPGAKWMLENVKMKKEFDEYITHHTMQALGYVEKTLINSALVSAQNRNRYYWTNFVVTQPEDKGIFLRDILEDGLSSGIKPKEKALKVFNVNPSGRGMNGNVYHTDAKSPTLTTNKGEGIKITNNDVTYRKLTPLECERLQTVPDNFTAMLSNTQRYKALGNGWTIDVIAHIFKHI